MNEINNLLAQRHGAFSVEVKEKNMNGDQIQFEIDNQDTPPEQRPDWSLPSFDARDWAAHFKRLFPDSDEALMQGWFANALMRGFDEGRKNPRGFNAISIVNENTRFLSARNK